MDFLRTEATFGDEVKIPNGKLSYSTASKVPKVILKVLKIEKSWKIFDLKLKTDWNLQFFRITK